MKDALPVGVRRVLPDLVREVRGAAGERLVGVYLYGSAVGGDFDEGVSDVDLVVAVTGEVPDDTIRSAMASNVRALAEWVPQVTHRGGHAHAVLTACRALFTRATGRQASKAEAARWAVRAGRSTAR